MRIRLLAGMIAAWAAAAMPAGAAGERGEHWRADIAVARDQFLAKDRSYPPQARAAADARLTALRSRVDALTDREIVAELARVAALAGNAHTRAYLLRNRGYWRRYPIRIWRFTDGFRVVAAQGAGEALLGRRIARIAGKPIAAALSAVKPLYAGNDQWADYMATYTLTSPDALLATGVVAAEGPALFESDDGARAQLDALPFTPRATPEESWWFLMPGHAAASGWRQALAPAHVPLYLAGAANYRAARCGGGRVLYVQFNRAENAGGDRVADFGARLIGSLSDNPPGKLAIDLRFNTGGDLTLADPLFRQLAALPLARKKDGLFVILGPATFSAGLYPAAFLKQETRARFAGTPPGDALQFWAEGGNVVLPNSKLTLHYADLMHSYLPGPPPVDASLVKENLDVGDLMPDLPAQLSWRDYAAGRDPAMARIAAASPDCR